MNTTSEMQLVPIDKRYIEQVGYSDGVSVVRDGKTIPYAELEVANEE